jgi:hypothetical protein
MTGSCPKGCADHNGATNGVEVLVGQTRPTTHGFQVKYFDPRLNLELRWSVEPTLEGAANPARWLDEKQDCRILGIARAGSDEIAISWMLRRSPG